jgi:hypothetical protein
VLPVSDDGGSTAEIVRVIGGPAVGDIRSRCLRLADDRDEEVRAPQVCMGVCVWGGGGRAHMRVGVHGRACVCVYVRVLRVCVCVLHVFVCVKG